MTMILQFTLATPKCSLFRRAFFAALLLCFIVRADAQERGAIGGRVVTEDGTAMAGVTVFLGSYGLNRPAGQPQTALTDEEGNFRFNNLPPRSYIVSVADARGYVQAPLLTGDVYTPHVYRVGETATVTLVKGGVITGRVTTAGGEPMIGTYVAAIRVRDAEGNKVRLQGSGRQRMTDDRGIYRLYGLQPGTYLVVANNSPAFFNPYQSSPYDGETPTYYPTATRDTATEITVVSGNEVSGVDIRHRGERGHAISGKVIGSTEQFSPVGYVAQITLFNPATGMQVGGAIARQSETENGFALLGIPDGEYEVEAYVGGSDRDQSLRSEARRVAVKGADVAGVELKLAPLASIAGRVVIEPVANACDAKTKHSPEEILVRARRDEKLLPDSPSILRSSLATFSPGEKGDFKMNALLPGRYRIEANLPNENWFLKSITGGLPAGASPRQTPTRTAPGGPAGANDLARNAITLKSGGKISGVTLGVADGAAGLRGKVVAAVAGAKLPSRLRVHLVPADAALAEEVLRYAEMQVGSDGEFAFGNLAPGKYWLLARAVSDAESSDRPSQPVAWDPAERAKLRKDAEAAKNEIELKACQRVKDQVLRF